MEEWRPVSGYEGAYEVSSEGRARSLDRVSSGKSLRGRVLKPGPGSSGLYLLVNLCRNGKPRTASIHRLVNEAFNGPAPEGRNVTRHLNGDSRDNRPVNLAWGTVAENIRDTRDHGTNSRTVRTHCPAGHEHTEFNRTAASRKSGRRSCKACHRAQSWARVRGLSPSDPAAREYADIQFERLRDGD